jgi:hypothetical protein
VPPGAAVLARRFQTGGTAGNVASGTIRQLQAAVGGIEAVFNPRPAEGGANGETLASLAERGPRSVRHRGRPLAAADYETMAREASSAVAFARAIPLRDAAGRLRPGWVSLLILPEGRSAAPGRRSAGARPEVHRGARLASLAASHRLS